MLELAGGTGSFGDAKSSGKHAKLELKHAELPWRIKYIEKRPEDFTETSSKLQRSNEEMDARMKLVGKCSASPREKNVRMDKIVIEYEVAMAHQLQQVGLEEQVDD